MKLVIYQKLFPEHLSRLQIFFKIGFLKNFAKFTEKQPMLESLFNKHFTNNSSTFIYKQYQGDMLTKLLEN